MRIPTILKKRTVKKYEESDEESSDSQEDDDQESLLRIWRSTTEAPENEVCSKWYGAIYVAEDGAD